MIPPSEQDKIRRQLNHALRCGLDKFEVLRLMEWAWEQGKAFAPVAVSRREAKPGKLPEMVAVLEQDKIVEAYQRLGTFRLAAWELGIGITTIKRRLAEYGVVQVGRVDAKNPEKVAPNTGHQNAQAARCGS